MASLLRSPAYHRPPQSELRIKSFETLRPLECFKQRRINQFYTCIFDVLKTKNSNFLPFASSKETNYHPEETQSQENPDDDVPIVNSSNDQIVVSVEKTASAIMESLELYKEALASNTEPKIAEMEIFFRSLEEDKNYLATKLASLSKELSLQRDHRFRIRADLNNFRSRTERDRLSLVTDVRREVVLSLLPVLDNFERAKSEINVKTKGETKINNSYQSIFKQFVEILGSLSVVTVDTAGNPFDPIAQYRVGSKLNPVLEQLIQVLKRVRSGFMKT